MAGFHFNILPAYDSLNIIKIVSIISYQDEISSAG